MSESANDRAIRDAANEWRRAYREGVRVDPICRPPAVPEVHILWPTTAHRSDCMIEDCDYFVWRP